MYNGVSLDEACQTQALDPQDFARQCNEDGTVKTQSNKTEFQLKSDPSKSIAIDSAFVLYSLIVVVLIVVAAIYLFRRRRRSRQAPKP